jgi:glycosyltransferase involved in cell wall biosynthesis
VNSSPASGGYCVVIPTYNNRATVRGVVEAALEQVATVIVVDDGCTDGTAEELASLPIVLVRHSRNRGKGRALRTGFQRAFELGYTHAVTLDSDGQHFPEEIPLLIAASREHANAVVIGARDMSGEHVPGGSKFGRMFSNFWLKVATGAEVEDSQSGFRLYPLRHVTRVGCIFGRFTYECEVIIRMAWGGCRIMNVPVNVYYPPKEVRVTHYDHFWDNVWFTCLYLYMNFSHLLVPLPHKRLVRREKPLWQGGIGATAREAWNRMLKLADLPVELTRGGPVKRFRELMRYVVSEKNTPGELGMAVGIGAFIGCSPWIGFHWILALYAATRVHLNRVACIAATNISFGPLTAVIAFASIWLGKLLLGQPLWMPRTMDWQVLGRFAAQSFGAWVLGSAIIGLAAAFATGLGTLYGVRALRRRKQANVPTATAPQIDAPTTDAAQQSRAQSTAA